MADSYFQTIDRTNTSARFEPSPHTAGPWNPGLQHGGPPNALAVEVAERALRTETGREDFVALRLAADFVGPVPISDIEVSTRIVRAARSAALVHVSVRGGERECLLVRIWFVRQSDTTAVAAAQADADDTESAINRIAATERFRFPYGQSVQWRVVKGGAHPPGPSAAWASPQIALVDGVPATGLARAVLIADAGNGLSAELDWAEWSFVNVDLDVHLSRPLVGDWVYMDAQTDLGPNGSGLARSRLADVHGEVGVGLQTLVVSRFGDR